MTNKNEKPIFIDSPGMGEWSEAIAEWRLPELPDEIKGRFSRFYKRGFRHFCDWYRSKRESFTSLRILKRDEETVINWLYDFIRLNVKRGPVFHLREVLQTGDADCLGYAKLFTSLGRECGLDLGVVEVIIDNRGLNVPHTAVLIKRAGGTWQCVDFWYGSRYIRHKRLSLQVKRGDFWTTEDLDFRQIKNVEDINYLLDDHVDAITFYILGNRALKEGDYPEAVEQYNAAIRIFPENARVYYNRAIAYEKMGQPEKAREDYARALQDEAALKRTLATQPRDVVDLMKLDEKCIPELDQEIYLLHSGFITGERVPPEKIARRLDLPQDEVEAVLLFMDRIL